MMCLSTGSGGLPLLPRRLVTQRTWWTELVQFLRRLRYALKLPINFINTSVPAGSALKTGFERQEKAILTPEAIAFIGCSGSPGLGLNKTCRCTHCC